MAVRLGLRCSGPGAVDRLLQLRELVVQVGDRSRGVGVLEVDGRRAALQLPRVEKCGEVLGDVVEDALAALLLGLQALPVRADAPRGPRLDLAEDVGVPRDELVVDPARDGGEVALALLLQQQREEVGLEEEVAELVLELPRVARQGGVRDLVGLLNRVRDDRLRGLLAIPRAVAPQPLGELLELEEGVG
jgi:hypothetical protein